MDEQISRREFLKTAGKLLGAATLPPWLANIKENEMFSAKELMELLDEEDEVLLASGYEGWREDLLESEDFVEALELSFSFLVSSGVDAMEFFIERGWFLDE